MLIVPSVDVRGGRLVRLVRGDYGDEILFDQDPVDMVRSFVGDGARRVHIVDLDAARGRPDEDSTALVRAAVAALVDLGAQAEVGGGIRDVDAAQRWFDAGAALVVIGSLAVQQPDTAQALCAAFPGHVLAGLDVRDGEARADGWTRAGGDALLHLDRWRSWPLAGVVFTAIERDGMLQGPAVDPLRTVCERFDGAVIASGGVTTLDDVRACAGAGAAGVIVGRALHQGIFDLRQAIAAFADEVA